MSARPRAFSDRLESLRERVAVAGTRPGAPCRPARSAGETAMSRSAMKAAYPGVRPGSSTGRAAPSICATGSIEGTPEARWLSEDTVHVQSPTSRPETAPPGASYEDRVFAGILCPRFCGLPRVARGLGGRAVGRKAGGCQFHLTILEHGRILAFRSCARARRSPPRPSWDLTWWTMPVAGRAPRPSAERESIQTGIGPVAAPAAGDAT